MTDKAMVTPQMILDTAAWNQSEDDLRDTLRMAAEALSAALAQAGQPVAVKALEWNGHFGHTPLGMLYVVSDYNGGAILEKIEGSATTKSAWPSREEAKSAAQADYEQRILSALSPAKREAGETAPPVPRTVASGEMREPGATDKAEAIVQVVKPLVWQALNEGFGHGRTHYGTGAFGHWYGVSRSGAGTWSCVHHVGGAPVHLPSQSTLEEAKATAEEDYARRISAEVDLVPANATLTMLREAYVAGWNASLLETRPFKVARETMAERYLGSLAISPVPVSTESVSDTPSAALEESR